MSYPLHKRSTAIKLHKQHSAWLLTADTVLEPAAATLSLSAPTSPVRAFPRSRRSEARLLAKRSALLEQTVAACQTLTLAPRAPCSNHIVSYEWEMIINISQHALENARRERQTSETGLPYSSGQDYRIIHMSGQRTTCRVFARKSLLQSLAAAGTHLPDPELSQGRTQTICRSIDGLSWEPSQA